MDREKKNQAKNYPQFAFRVPTEGLKKKLMSRVSRLHAEFNRTTAEDEKLINKNDIILKALDLGLSKLEVTDFSVPPVRRQYK